VAKLTTLAESADLTSLMGFDGGHRSPTIADFVQAKQDLYDAIGNLVIASQELNQDESDPRTGSASPTKGRRTRPEGVKSAIKAGEAVKSKVQGLCLQVSFMVEEDKKRRRKALGGKEIAQNLMTSGTAGRYRLSLWCL
jgi:hypothetical protein